MLVITQQFLGQILYVNPTLAGDRWRQVPEPGHQACPTHVTLITTLCHPCRKRPLQITKHQWIAVVLNRYYNLHCGALKTPLKGGYYWITEDGSWAVIYLFVSVETHQNVIIYYGCHFHLWNCPLNMAEKCGFLLERVEH